MTPYREMALNNAWSNATLYAALSGLDTAAFTAPRPGFFASLTETMNHIYAVDLYYIDALEEAGLGRSVYNRARVDDVPTLAALQAEADLRLARFCTGLSETDLTRTVTTARGDAPGAAERVEWLLLHLFQHQVHHRGQAHVQLSHAGIAPPQLDEFFLDYDRAPTAHPYWTET
ncbi:DinB family protein [Pseudooceanicola onchidii]|uniref:DinB family protein n=1 Tax=Pseudooceanicola onchidii TaxID=2562279 RepID=UPI001F0D7F8E|nr:DinB family protein [Pseudooceanicola onchidii]